MNDFKHEILIPSWIELVSFCIDTQLFDCDCVAERLRSRFIGLSSSNHGI